MQIAVIAGVIFLGALIQSAVGFAFSLFATPLLVWRGVPLPNAITTVALCAFIQSLMGARHLRASIPWRLSMTAAGIRLLHVVPGLIILHQLTTLAVDDVRFAVGCALCVLVAVQSLKNTRPAETLHWAWSGLAFATSGILSGAFGMGGPPLVLWALAHDWSVEKTRGILFTIFAASIPLQLLMLYFKFGPPILHSMLLALLISPVTLTGAGIGLWLGNHLPKSILRRIVQLILLGIGLSSTVPYLIEHLGK